MAAQKPLRSEPHAANHPEALDGLVGVLGAGRLETAAAREEDGKVSLVTAQGEERHPNRRPLAHASRFSGFGDGSSFRSSALSSANGASATIAFGCITMSHPREISLL